VPAWITCRATSSARRCRRWASSSGDRGRCRPAGPGRRPAAGITQKRRPAFAGLFVDQVMSTRLSIFTSGLTSAS
jgi:hypothetical protein